MTKLTRRALQAIAAITIPTAGFCAYAGFATANATLIGVACFMVGAACMLAIAADC